MKLPTASNSLFLIRILPFIDFYKIYAWNFSLKALTVSCVCDKTQLEITVYEVIYSKPNMVLLIFSFYNENLVYLFPIQLPSSTKELARWWRGVKKVCLSLMNTITRNHFFIQGGYERKNSLLLITYLRLSY